MQKFTKPEVKDNHLEDTMLYSKRFFANKDRTQRFYDLEIENFNEENILVGLLSAICKTRTCLFEEVLRIVISENAIKENKYFEEMDKYELPGAFWKLCEQQFGYVDLEPSLEKLIATLFVTYTDRYIQGGVPKAWRSFVSMKQGNSISNFLINNNAF